MKRCSPYSIFHLSFLILTMCTLSLSAQVPPPPTEAADRLGVYAWGFEPSAYSAQANGQIDRLNWAADRVAQVGSRTIRVTLPGLVYGLPINGDLAEIAASPEYVRLFTDPRFKTYLLTVKTTGAFFDPIYSWAPNWFDGYTAEESAATRDEIGRLGDFLLRDVRFTGKTFILLNWEADNEIIPYRDRLSSWDSFTDWINSIADGVNDARSKYPDSGSKLFSGFEFNLVSREGKPCGTAVSDPLIEEPLKHRCAVDYIAPRARVDYYSYSSWQTLDVKFEPQGSYKSALRRDLDFALALVRRQRPEIEEQNFIIGEFGIHRTRWGEKTVANYIAEMIDAVMDLDGFQVSYAVWWQIIDNLQFNLVWDEGFGLFRSRNGLFYLNLVGETFSSKLKGEAFSPLTGGPLLRRSPPGILNATTGGTDFSLHPNSPIEVNAGGFETPFSDAGNKIHIEQMMNAFLISADTAPDFTESALRLTATLPQGLRPGNAFIQVLDGSGVETQGQTVHFNCDSCPVITRIIDSDKGLGEYHPGTIVDIHGSNFSVQGNTVIIEQQDVMAQRFSKILKPEEILIESPEMLRVKLPDDLAITRFNVVVIANSGGLESNMYALSPFPDAGIVPQCPGCAPVIGLIDGIRNLEDGGGNFLPGRSISIRGARFSPSGNTVVVQQGDQRFILDKNESWNESIERINASLPLQLQPGLAVIYVINAAGLEGRPRMIKIARGLSPTRNPIRRGAPGKIQ